MVEQYTGGSETDVISLALMDRDRSSPVGLSVAVHPPRTRFFASTESARYVRKANRVTIRHLDGDVVAVVEVVSPGNKDSRIAILTIARKAMQLLNAGVNLRIGRMRRRTPVGCLKRVAQLIGSNAYQSPLQDRVNVQL